MGKKFLIAMDDSENAFRAVDFVGNTFAKDHFITLFGIVPNTALIIDMTSPELTPYYRSEHSHFLNLEDMKKNLISEALDKAKSHLMALGFEDDHIKIITQIRKRGVARDIITEAENGYDMIILGRRGLSSITEFFMGSVSQKVIHSVKNSSVLVVN